MALKPRNLKASIKRVERRDAKKRLIHFICARHSNFGIELLDAYDGLVKLQNEFNLRQIQIAESFAPFQDER